MWFALFVVVSVCAAVPLDETNLSKASDLFFEEAFTGSGDTDGSRIRKSPNQKTTICVEVKPNGPYQKPYTMCHEAPGSTPYGAPQYAAANNYGSPSNYQPQVHPAPSGYGSPAHSVSHAAVPSYTHGSPNSGYGSAASYASKPSAGSYGPTTHGSYGSAAPANGYGSSAGHGNAASPSGYGSAPAISHGYASAPTGGYGSSGAHGSVAPTSGYGGSPATSNYGSSVPASGYGSSAGHGSVAPTSGYGGSAPASSYGSAPASGYGSAPASNHGSSAPASGYGSAPASNHGSSAPASGYGSVPSSNYASSAPASGYGSSVGHGSAASVNGYGKPVPASTYGSASASGYSSSAGHGNAAPANAYGSSGSSNSYGSSAPAIHGSSAPASAGYSAPVLANHGPSGYGAPSYGSAVKPISHALSGYGNALSLPQLSHSNSYGSSPAYRSQTLNFDEDHNSLSTFFGDESQPGDIDMPGSLAEPMQDEHPENPLGRTAYVPPIPYGAPASHGYNSDYSQSHNVIPANNVQYTKVDLGQSSCGVPLMFSCQPSVYMGKYIHPKIPQYSAPAYRPRPQASYSNSYSSQSYSASHQVPSYAHPSAPAYGHTAAAPAYGHNSAGPAYGHAASAPAYGLAAPAPEYGHAPAYGHAQSAPAYGHAQSAPAYGHAQSAPAYGHTQSAPTYGHAQSAPAYGHAQSAPAYGHAQSAPGYGHAQSAQAYGQASQDYAPAPTYQASAGYSAPAHSAPGAYVGSVNVGSSLEARKATDNTEEFENMQTNPPESFERKALENTTPKQESVETNEIKSPGTNTNTAARTVPESNAQSVENNKALKPKQSNEMNTNVQPSNLREADPQWQNRQQPINERPANAQATA